MEEFQKIRLFGSRDFAGNFDMTLSFVKQNYVPIIKALAIVIPVLLIIAFVAPTNSLMGDFSSYTDPLDIYGEIFTVGYFVSIFLNWLVMYVISLYVVAYMALYAKSPDGKVKSSEVWSKMADVFLPVFGASILFGIMFMIGLMLCIIPGIILYVYLGFYMYVYINEEKGIIDSFYRSFELVTRNWWVTFGYGLIFLVLIYIGQMIFSIPSFITGIGIGLRIDFLTSQVFLYIATFISEIGSFLLIPIMYMAMGVMYYSHRNKIERIDLESDIDSIGDTSDEN
ncbi:MAG: hypothetical protein LBV43_06000 [Prevotella sp.]|jgi:hypothetical protein|nr:hypothetical protein [Prevotella sp.]